MNDNGYIRKIDDLGRIVIPKEIRSKLKIQDNENIYIKLEDNKISINKYSYLSTNKSTLKNICNLFYEIFKLPIEVYDSNSLILKIGDYCYDNEITEDIIYDSVCIGKIKINTIEVSKTIINICKFLSKTISSLIY